MSNEKLIKVIIKNEIYYLKDFKLEEYGFRENDSQFVKKLIRLQIKCEDKEIEMVANYKYNMLKKLNAA